ncbi:MAG: hypothetical protein M1828_000238 [Chrysothrix sp. TS-e1954]|nr:MAG: hypothetical protein M1828_000238 [Chrysothrix sp. TS-e1954]
MGLVVVTGAASGIGRAFVKALSSTQETVIFAVDKAFPDPNDASTSAGNYSFESSPKARIKRLTIDVTDPKQVERLSASLQRQSVDLVIHSAGIRGLVPSVPISDSNDVAKAENLAIMDAATLERTIDINTIGTFLVLKALLPALQRSRNRARVIVMGSRMGSIGHNTSGGGAYAYRASKAGLNAIVKSMSIDVPDVTWLVVHPGRLETGLVAVKEDGALSADEGVADVMRLIDQLGPKDSGRFVDRFGVDIPW